VKDKDIIALIEKRRKQCLIHRYCYYVLAAPLISDVAYDNLEADLKRLVTLYPEQEHKAAYSLMCPTRTVGSSNLDDYPRAVEDLALSLVKHGEGGKSGEALSEEGTAGERQIDQRQGDGSGIG
jgi:NAD-dependent DNA ligase